MKRPSKKTLFGGLIVFLVCIVLGMGSYILTNKIGRVDTNTETIQEIQKDRAQRIVEACMARHSVYLAFQSQLDLIAQLLHQTNLDDSRIPPNLRSLAKENLVKADAKVEEAHQVILKSDCITPVLP